MPFQSVTGKMGNMRKAVRWVVYPLQSDDAGSMKRTIQSDARIAEVDLATGKARLSKACPSGAYFIHLAMGATEVDCPADILDQLKAMTPHVGPVSLSELARA